MRFCVRNSQLKLRQTAFCGRDVKGPHIDGLNNLMYYEGTGPVCPDCLRVVVKKLKELKGKAY